MDPTSPDSLLAWGQTSQGQLGVGGIEESCITQPRPVKYLRKERLRVKAITCGHAHTVFLMEGKGVWSCGSNEKGQCGQDTSSTRPAPIPILSSLQVVQVSCGHSHSLALTASGQLYAWGSNEFGQLGRQSDGQESHREPKLVESLAKMECVQQVTCGGFHNLALLRNGRVYSWGRNSYGQLGHSHAVPAASTPLEVHSLQGLPILHIAAGDAHSLVVSRSGAVYGWGRNTFGQLGVGHEKDTVQPTELTTLRTHRVRFIACGEKHTAALTEDGGLFTFGSSSYGQLGHNSTHSTTYPTKVFELMGSTVSQVACGRCHTMALVRSTGKVYSFGLGGSGQLGNGQKANVASPCLVSSSWQSPGSLPGLVGSSVDPGSPTPPARIVKGIFAGGDHSFVSLVVPGEEDGSVIADYRVPQLGSLPPVLQFDDVKKLLDESLIKKDYSDAMNILHTVFSSPASLNGSFLSSNPTSHHHSTGKKCSGVDLEEAVQTLTLIKERLSSEMKIVERLNLALIHVLQALHPKPLSLECCRIYLILPAYFLQPTDIKLFSVFANTLANVGAEWKAVVGNWVCGSPGNYLHLWLSSTKEVISKVLLQKKEESSKNLIDEPIVMTKLDESTLQAGLKLLKCIHEWNTRHGELLPYKDFHIEAVTDVVDFVADFFNWIEAKPGVTVFCQYPFVLNSKAKAELLKVESKVQMHIAVNHAHRRTMQGLLFHQVLSDASPFSFRLIVRRDNLIKDTLDYLVSTEPNNYKKPLQVEFVGEEGMDAGGVQKEFFMLLLKDILNPHFGMFLEDEESHYIWFREEALLYGSLNYFKLIGIVCGLAIYNSVIIDLPFPAALYKKLLKKPTDLSDLKQLHPSVGAGLETMLGYEGDDFQETFGLHFEITRSSFGESVAVPLIPGGSSRPVTKEDRNDYVRAYVRYVLDESVREPFQAFDEGFKRVCEGKVLSMLHPLELMSLVIGQKVIDWTEMEKYMEYRNGYHKDHPIIKLFWKVFYDLPVEAKKKFLVFLTGSDRIPVAGVASMKMMIQRMDGGPGCERLPVAHTCFNVLDLPPYRSPEQMKQKLLQAIHFTSGFGIV